MGVFPAASMASAAVGFLASTAFAGLTGAGALRATSPVIAPVPAEIPAFSRRYGTSCSTCHVTPGKLNAEGEAFRLNGYRFPTDDESLRQDDPVALGAEPWKDLWPDAIWPGEIPGVFPLALHVANDARVARAEADGRWTASYAFPEAVHLSAATTLGGGFAVFVDVAWRRGPGLHVSEAKVKVQDVLPWLPDRAANLWIGTQRIHLLTFGDLSLDRAARQPFSWQLLSLGDWELEDPTTGETLVSESRFRPGAGRPAVEVNGLLGGRLYYGFGAAQPASTDGDGGNRVSDIYGKLRYKLWGLRLDGRPPDGFEPRAWGGQLLDQGVTIEHFAYFGETPAEHGSPDRHRSFGLAVRTTQRRGEVGVGHVWGRNSRPWNVPELAARRSSSFARAEYLIYPWLLGSAAFDRIEFRPISAAAASMGLAPFQRVRALPAVVVLPRANVRGIVEGELFLRDRSPSAAGERRPHALWLRMDVAF